MKKEKDVFEQLKVQIKIIIVICTVLRFIAGLLIGGLI